MRSMENMVISHSLNYTESYEIDVVTFSTLSCSRVSCKQSLECEAFFPTYISTA